MERQRLDKWLWHARVVKARTSAAALVEAGHVRVNGARERAPGHAVKIGDVVTVRERSHKVVRIQEALELSQRRGVPEWLEVDRPNFTGRIRALPARSDLTMPINEKLVVELYSK